MSAHMATFRAVILVALAACASPAWAQATDDTATAVRALLDSRDRAAGRPVASDLLAARDAQIAELTARVAALAPLPTANDPAVSVGDVTVGPGQRSAQVPVTLSEPTNHTLVVKWGTANGDGTWSGGQYAPASGWLVFQPGERVKVAMVPLTKDLAAAQTIKVTITARPGVPPATIAKGIGVVRGGGAAPAPAVTADAAAMTPRPTGKALTWAQDFADPAFCVTDTGLGKDGKPCWQGRPTHGLTQDGNKETGLYASPDRFPSVTMTGLGPDGKRFIQLERHPEGFSEGGKPLVHSWDGKPFVYSSAMLTGAKLPAVIKTGSYVEARVRMDLVAGTWPAFWLLPADGSWPPEVDVFEGFWSASKISPDTLTMTQHWVAPDGKKTGYGTDVPLSVAVPGFDVRAWHVYGVSIEADWLTYYVDDKPVWRAPNAMKRGVSWYPLLDVATGGPVGEPAPDAPLPAKMGLDWIKVWN